jgi:hypothetical protein
MSILRQSRGRRPRKTKLKQNNTVGQLQTNTQWKQEQQVL